MSFPRYPKYKPSGVEWAGQIPEPWTPTRLRFLLRDGYDGMKIGPFGSQLTSDMLDESGAYKVYGQENVIANDFSRGSRFIGDDKFHELAVYEIIPGDLLITMMGTSGRCDVAPSTITRGIMDSHLLRMRTTNSVTPQFARLLIDEAAYVKMQIQLAGKGTIMHGLNSSIVKDLLFFVPSFNEQAAILEFLDRETSKIDGLVAEQRRLIELLKEKRQAVISHAVTKGLNPNAKMKPSGVEWLGDVPEHWKINSFRHILDAIGDVDHFMPESVENGVPYLMTGDLREFVSDVSLDDCKQVSRNDYLELSKRIKSSKGDVIMARYATIGTSMYVDIDIEFLVSYSCVTLKTNHSKLSGLYLFYYMKSDAFRQGVENQINTNTQGNVGIKDLQRLKIAVASIDEQIAIAAFLDTELAKFDTLTAEAQRAIDLLQERRTALISAAVTGQIDVRQEVSN